MCCIFQALLNSPEVFKQLFRTCTLDHQISLDYQLRLGDYHFALVQISNYGSKSILYVVSLPPLWAVLQADEGYTNLRSLKSNVPFEAVDVHFKHLLAP